MEKTKRKEEEFNHQRETQKRSKIKGREEVIIGPKEKQKLNWMQKRG